MNGDPLAAERSSRRPRRSRGRRLAALAAAAFAHLLAGRAAAWEFTDVTAAAGVAYEHGYDDPASLGQPEMVSGGVAAGDYDRDGWIDLYVVRGDRGPNLLFRNRGDGTFAEVGAAAGVALPAGAWTGPTFADIDGDGWLDLIVLGVGGLEPHLFHNQRDGTFTDVTAASKLAMGGNPSFSAAFGDYDGDGDLDLFVTHWSAPLLAAAQGHLWRNEGDGTFTDVSAAAGIPLFHSPTPGFPAITLSFTANFADVDGDGRPDLLVSADFGASRVLHNNGDGTFTDVTDPSVVTDQNGMGSAIADYDNDGDLDWFVSSVWDPNGVAESNWGVTGNRLYRNTGGGAFADATDAAGVRQGYWGWGATFADLNNDGFLDLVHVNGWGLSTDAKSAEFHADPTRVFVAQGDGTFVESAASLGAADVGQGRGVVAFDYDRDGDLDLFIANNQGPARLLRNDGGNAGRFIGVKLLGRAPNSEAIGARIYLTTGAVTQMRELRAGSNFESQDPAEAHFGTGTASTVDQLRVRWPGGAETLLGPLRADGRISLNEPVAGSPTCTAAAPANACSPGGSSATDCALEWRVEPTPQRDKKGVPGTVVVCREGDPSCDADPDAANASCTFREALCINSADPRLARCTPSAVARGEVKKPKLGKSSDAADAANLAALRGQLAELGLGFGTGVFGNATPDRCGAAREIVVPLVKTKKGKLKPGTRQLAVKVVRPDGKADVDTLKLQCRPGS